MDPLKHIQDLQDELVACAQHLGEQIDPGERIRWSDKQWKWVISRYTAPQNGNQGREFINPMADQATGSLLGPMFEALSTLEVCFHGLKLVPGLKDKA